LTGLRILIAEDVEVVRRGIRSILGKRSNWKICGEAASGAETIEKAWALNPDLLLLNVTMPDMAAAAVIPGGIQLCPAIKIVALAMAGAAKPAANALAASADGLALKSEPARDFILTLKNVQNDQSYLSPAQ
jgi:DNA-binding NarL/FixJ family response regulator